MGLHPQNGGRSAAEFRKCVRGIRALLHFTLRADEEGLAERQDRRHLHSRGPPLLGAQER